MEAVVRPTRGPVTRARPTDRRAPPSADDVKLRSRPSIADPGPLGLAAFALTTFVLSFFNAGLVSDKAEPVVFGLAFAYGGIAQFLAGMWEFRTGNTFGAVAFSSYGAFWLSFWAYVQFYAAKIPAADAGHAVGLYLIAWGIFTTYMFVASLRTTAAVAAVFFLLAITFFLLGIGDAGRAHGHHEAGRLGRAGDRARRVVCVLRRSGERDVRPGGPAGTPAAVARAPDQRRGNHRWRPRKAPSSEQLEDLLEQERFEPPEDFVKDALVTDTVDARGGGEGPGRLVAEADARSCSTGSRSPTEALDDSNPPFFKWFSDGKLNVSHNCLDRHVEAGNGDRVAFHWRGEEGEERDITYADLLRDVQKFANALKDNGIEKGDVVGIFLPMIPEVVVAMLACARIGAPHNVVFGGFSVESVKERMEVSEAKALVTVDGARRKGKTAAGQAAGRRGAGRRSTSLERIFVVQRTKADCEMKDGRDVWFHEALEAGRRRVRGRAARRRAPAVHPLLLGLDGEAEGHPAHDRRLPDRRHVDAQATSSTSSPRTTSTGARPTSAGSPATATSSTGRSPTARRR